LDPTVLLTNDGNVNPIRQIARVEKVTNGKWEGLTSAGVTVSRSTESAEAADNSFVLAQPTVQAQRVIAEVPFSVKLDTAWPRFRAEVATVLEDAKNREEDSFITGDGTGVNPGGIIGSIAAGSLVASGATQELTDVELLEAALPSRYEDRASFLAAKSTYIQIRQLARTAGIADPWVSMVDGKPDELFGYSAYKASAVPAWAATGSKKWMVLGDFSRFLIVDQLGMSVEVRPHVLGTNRRWTGERAINAIWFNSSKILDDNAFRVLQAAA
jgi:HK97 family phage major capsid protein